MKQRADLHFRKAAPRATRYELPDRDGLVLEVQPSGRKTWRHRYRLDGRREKVTIGPHPTITLEEARDRRREAETRRLGMAQLTEMAPSASTIRELSTTFWR